MSPELERRGYKLTWCSKRLDYKGGKMKKVFIAFCFLLLFPGFVFAETWELAVQPWDKDDLLSGHKRAKQGDIIAVKPYPWEWGTSEMQNYLIVIIDNMTEEEAMELMTPLYEGDVAPTYNNASVITGKRKFKIDIDRLKANILPELDKNKLEDKFKTTNYQPFKDGGIKIVADTLDSDLIQNKYNLSWRKGKKK